jgi:nicotinamide phosphoribosyltransferase
LCCCHAHHVVLQYGEFRTGYNKDEQDRRILVYGLRYILENYVMRPWTADDVEKADIFFK